MATFESLSRETLSDQVADQLLEYIMSEGLKEGTVLPSEQNLAAQFEVSRPVIREALRSLAGQRIIQVINGKGAVVRPLDSHLIGLYFRRALSASDDNVVSELMEVRLVLEVPVAGLAARRRTEEDIEAIRRIVEKMETLDARKQEYVDLDVALHLAVARAAQNKALYDMVCSLRNALTAIVARVFSQPSETIFEEVRERSESTHRAFYEAIRDGEPAAAEDAMRSHLAHAMKAVSGLE